jgi:hypothetical protein
VCSVPDGARPASRAKGLFDGKADLIIHHIDKRDTRFEFIDLFGVQVVPAVAPGFLPFPVTDVGAIIRTGRSRSGCGAT